MTESLFAASPKRVHREDVTVLQQETTDAPEDMQRTWESFETLVGLRGRKMYGLMDKDAGRYRVCTPVRDGDHADELTLDVGVLPGGWYLQARLVAEPPELYAKIGPGFDELRAIHPKDPARPEVEFYRRRDEIDLWLPIEA